MPKTTRKSRTSKQKNQAGDELLQNEGEGKTRGNTRVNRSTGLSYRRPSRDYTRSTKWTYEMNKELLQLFADSKPDKRGYQKRLKELWDIRYPDHNKFTPKHLAEQVRNIKKKKLLPTTEISRINDGTGEDDRETSTQETREHNEEIQTEQANSETENQEDIEEGTGNIIEDENNIYREELNEEQLRQKENLRKLWKKNFDKYLNMNIEDREYSTKIKPIPEKQQLELLDQIVYEEVELLEEKYEINLWILNVIYYVTVITLMVNEGKLRLEKRTKKVTQKPGWKIRLESSIDAIRRKISYTYVLIECNRTQRITSHQKNIKRKIEKQYGKATTENLRYIQVMLKQDLKVQSEKLKRRNTIQQRRYINRMFRVAPEIVYRTMKGEDKGPIKDMPEKEKVEEFWGGLWSTATHINKMPHGYTPFIMNMQLTHSKKSMKLQMKSWKRYSRKWRMTNLERT